MGRHRTVSAGTKTMKKLSTSRNTSPRQAGRRGSAQLRAARFKSPTSYSPGTRKYSKKNTSEQTPVNKAPEVRNQGGEDENLELVYLSYANGSIEHIENAQNEAGTSNTQNPPSTRPPQSLPVELLNPLPDDNSVSSDELENLSEQALQKRGLKLFLNEFNALEVKEVLKLAEPEDAFELKCNEIAPPSPSNASPKAAAKVNETINTCVVCGRFGVQKEFYSKTICSIGCKFKAQRGGEQKSWGESSSSSKFTKNGSNGTVDKPTTRQTPEAPISEHWVETTPFCWEKYLEKTNSKPAPQKLFQSAFPLDENPFKVGQKLEAIDPERPSLICVVTIAEVKGYRIRLHFDGYSESYDFWENANSPNIFPVGFSHAYKQILQPPKEADKRDFKWSTYLKMTDSKQAPKEAFRNRPESSDLYGWTIGQKLEAEDKHNSNDVCVASVGNIMDGRILIHFDGWEPDFDFWAVPSSTCIHKVGYCEETGIKLHPPRGYKEPFSWRKYLSETSSVAVPSNSFKPPKSEVSLFRKGMKLEAVDKRNPSIIRVATVVDIIRHDICIHFDGWSEDFDYWTPDTSTDLHPVGWCAKTKHPLATPPTADEIAFYLPRVGCGIPGCRGIGHAKGARFATHSSVASCPYSSQNMDNDDILPERVMFKQMDSETGALIGDDDDDDQDTNRSSKLRRGVRKRKMRKFFDEDSPNALRDQESSSSRAGTPLFPHTKRRLSSGEKSSSPVLRNNQDSAQRQVDVIMDRHLASNSSNHINLTSSSIQSLREAVFRPQIPFRPVEIPLSVWEKNSAFLLPYTKDLTEPEVRRWAPIKVAQFVSTLPGVRSLNNEDICQRIIEEDIDGSAFMLLSQFDLVKLGLKLGPAIKVFNTVLRISSRTTRDLLNDNS